MKNYYLCFLLFGLSLSVFSQTIYKTINSSKLGEERELKIQLPRNYDTNLQKEYPLIIVLDGDYLFEPMAGNVDYYSYWDDIPESIVVGINMDGKRDQDGFYDDQRFLPDKSGALFFEFLGMELLPFLDKEYRTAKFIAVAGHDITANFINYYLFKPEPLFNAYINLSPDLAPEMAQRITTSLETAQNPRWFYLATASNDIPHLEQKTVQLDSQLKMIENPNLHYTFDNFENATHYTLVARALPKALEAIFEAYSPLGIDEYDAMVISDNSPLDLLQKKYETIEDFYGLQKKIRVNDFLATGKALEFMQRWEELEGLSDLARKHYPRSALGTYYQARSYEALGDTKKAMKTYQSAYGQEEIAFITTDFMLQKAEKIKEDFGY